MVGMLILAAVGAGGYELYLRTLGRPIEVQTAYVTIRQAGAPGVILTGSGYVVTRHKYITIGTKILGQIMEEPIEEGQHVTRGQLLERIDDRDYRAQLHQANADHNLAAANVQLKRTQAIRMRELYQKGVASRDQLDVAENALAVASATSPRQSTESCSRSTASRATPSIMAERSRPAAAPPTSSNWPIPKTCAPKSISTRSISQK
jgi:multidrug efflux pump subunit AcrA (membrane-fusion protein)